jgi:uncharacterized protein with von Willebrand factor type A (vWA) domain
MLTAAAPRLEALATARLAGFAGFLRGNGFALGGGDAAQVLRTAERVGVLDPQVLRWSLQALLCGRCDEWRRFDELFDAWFLPPNQWQRPELREAPRGTVSGGNPDGNAGGQDEADEDDPGRPRKSARAAQPAASNCCRGPISARSPSANTRWTSRP